MKKLVLFAAAMMLCAGMTMAQEPVKKDKTTNAKPAAEAQATPDKGTIAKPTVQAQPVRKSCGSCPHHAKCGSQQKPAQAAPKTDKEAKPQTTATTPKK